MANKIKSRAKRIYVVACAIHGVESDKWDGRMLKVSAPKHKRDRNSGCPRCAAETKDASAA
jgi:hypothetical protein